MTTLSVSAKCKCGWMSDNDVPVEVESGNKHPAEGKKAELQETFQADHDQCNERDDIGCDKDVELYY